MKKLLIASILFIASAVVAGAQQPAGLWLDASQFGKSDICLDIQAAIAALPITPLPGGAVIDARNFSPTSSTSYIHCSANPFTVQANPLLLVNGGTGTNCTTGPSAGCLGGVVLLPGSTIATDVPWLIPGNWSVIGQGGKVTVIAPSSTFSSNLSSYTTGTVSGASGSNTVTGSGTGWTSNTVGMVFTACATSGTCNAPASSYSSATVVGIVTYFASGTGISLGSALQTTLTAPSYYTLQAPVIAWATTMPCSPSCSGVLQGNTSGSVIQDIGISCVIGASNTGTPVSGCIPFWDQYGQERSQLKRVSFSGFLGLGFGIYTATAQNGGPFEDLDMVSGPGAIGPGTVCVEVGGTGVGGQPPTRGIRGLSCTNYTRANTGTDGIGVDINTQNFSLSDAHFEDYGVGVEVGDLSSARGVWISDITGGPHLGTVVSISSNCATASGSNCISATTSDINVQSVYEANSTTTFVDNISVNTATESTLGLYLLGDGSGLGTGAGGSTRPVMTTSSTIGSTPNLFGMAHGMPISGVQGTAGTLVQMSTGSTTSGDIGSFDSNGDLIDSGIASFGISTSGQGGVWLPTFSYPISGLNNTAIGMAVKAIQFVLPTKITFTKMTVDVMTPSTGSFNLGIYNASGGTKLADSGSISCGTSGAFGTTISAVTLQPGVYFFAYAATDSMCAIGAFAPASQVEIIMNRVATRQGTSSNSLSGGSLPGSLGTISSTTIDPAVAFIEP